MTDARVGSTKLAVLDVLPTSPLRVGNTKLAVFDSPLSVTRVGKTSAKVLVLNHTTPIHPNTSKNQQRWHYDVQGTD